MTSDTIGTNSTWYVVAQIGRYLAETDEYIELNMIVMAERDIEYAAILECNRRNALNDGRKYFVISQREHQQITKVAA